MPRIAVAIELDWPITHHYDVIHGVQQFADEAADWELEIGAFPEVHLRRGHRYDGVVGRITPSILAAARAAGIPVVNTWVNSPVSDEVPTVQIDHVAAGRIAAEHLYGRGLRRLVCLTFRGQAAPHLGYEGMAAIATARGCSLQRLLVNPRFESKASAWEQFVQIVHEAAENWKSPLGLIAADDMLARAAVSEMGRLGIDVPHDLAVVGVGNNDTICTHLFPTLSSVDCGYERVGYEAANLLAGLMRGDAPPDEIVRVPPTGVIARDSSDFFAVNDTRVAAALRYMAEKSEQPITVRQVAEAAGIAQQNLNRLFHRYVGHTVNAELIRLRVEQFKRLLVTSDEPLEELARRAGFGSAKHVYRTFKGLTGQTPAEYREERRLRKWSGFTGR